MRKRGWNDEITETLKRRKKEAGMADRSEIDTMFAFMTSTKAAQQPPIIPRPVAQPSWLSGQRASCPFISIANASRRYGFAAGVGMRLGGGGGVIRQSINFQTKRMSNAVMIAATICRVRVSRTGLLRKGVDSLRQRKIEIGQAALAMSRKHQPHLVKANVDIRMVLFFLRYVSHCIHKINRIGEIVELERALDVLFLELPLGHFFQPHFCFIGFDQIRHIGQTSNTRKLFCKRRFTLRQNQAGAEGRPRILRRFLSESKSSTATERDCRETKAQSEMILLMASLADSRSCTKRNPLCCGKYFDPPVSSVTTGRPIARNVAARSLSQPVCHATSTPLIAVNSALADAT